MPRILTIDSQTPNSADVFLSWGDLVATPPADDLVRLAPGETFTIPEGHATSIRTKDGWQCGYALSDTPVTGPMDISTPIAMSKRDFAPKCSIETKSGAGVLVMLLIGGSLYTLALMQAASAYGMLAILATFLAGVLATTLAFFVVIKFFSRKEDKEGLHACADSSRKTFWRDDLEWAQSQPIRKARAN